MLPIAAKRITLLREAKLKPSVYTQIAVPYTYMYVLYSHITRLSRI